MSVLQCTADSSRKLACEECSFLWPGGFGESFTLLQVCEGVAELWTSCAESSNHSWTRPSTPLTVWLIKFSGSNFSGMIENLIFCTIWRQNIYQDCGWCTCIVTPASVVLEAMERASWPSTQQCTGPLISLGIYMVCTHTCPLPNVHGRVRGWHGRK